jgi:integrase
MKRRKLWSKSIGTRGHRVRVYEPRPGAPLMRSIWIHGKEDRKSLGHRDRTRAVREMHSLLASLESTEQLYEEQSLTLGQLVRLYVGSEAFAEKKQRTRIDDERKLIRIIQFFGEALDVAALCETRVKEFTRRRKAGWPTGKPVGNRAVEADLVALCTALNWAARNRDRKGRRLLRENPLVGIKLPREKNPARPVVDHETFLALLAVAHDVAPMLRVALVVAEATGRRISAITGLRWDDVDFGKQVIRWRAENDKKGYEQVVPTSPAVIEELERWRKESGAIGLQWIFPAPKDATKRCSRHLLDDWLRRAYKISGRQKPKGGLWHPFRRKWATERKNYPIRDVVSAGGWRDMQTVLRSYQQPDAETTREVILNPTRRLGS